MTTSVAAADSPCPQCGSKTSFRTEAGICKNTQGCTMRRITRRIALDKKRGARQCMSPRGKGSIRFCLLGDGHDGLHANGGLEWGSGHRTPVGDLYAEVLSKRAG